ncbi:MAG: diguanylate cyclase [Aminivibrio sp.]|nr:diguanylate cyclase [Aminivibrio sp.]
MLSANVRSVRGMLGIFSVLLAAAMVLFPVLLGILNFRDSWLQTARDMEQALGMQADFIRKWFVFHQNDLRSISHLSSVNARDLDRMHLDFTYFSKSCANFDSMVYVDTSGVPLVHSDLSGPGRTGFSVADRPYFLAAKKGQGHITNILTGRNSGKPVVIISVPLLGKEGFQGLIFGSVSFDTILSTLNTAPFRTTGNFLLFNSGGADGTARLAGISREEAGQLEAHEEKVILYRDGEGIQWIARGTSIPEYGLTVAVRMEFREFLAPYLAGLAYFGGASILLLAASLLISGILYRKVNSSLSLLLEAVEQTGDGKYSPLDPLTLENAPHEMKKLGGAFNIMARSLKNKTEELEFRSFHDELTGLYNRSYFEDTLARLGTGRFDPVTVVMCDVNGLKLVNDTLGHKAGDGLLRAAADVLRKSVRQSDIVARIGGDEFAALLPEDENGEAGRRFPGKLASNIREYRTGDDALPLNISWGTASGTRDESSVESLVQEADKRMYVFKQTHRPSSRKDVLDYLSERIALVRKDSRDRHMAACAALMEIFAASRSEFSPEKRAYLVKLARNHDLGFTEIPREIFDKPGPLTEEEYEVVKRHPERGSHIVSLFPDLSDLKEDILLHHRWWNGAGYPEGEGGDALPEGARIMAVVDAYEAMTGDKAYRDPKSPAAAAAELRRCGGTQFDPYWAEEFARFILDFHEGEKIIS